jgi:hypothetical protein
VTLAIQTAHKYWNDCVCKSQESLRCRLNTLVDSPCEHREGKICTLCKLQRRTTLYGFLWADFATPSASENTEHLTVIDMALENTLIIMAARGDYAENGEMCDLEAVGRGEEAVLTHLEKL